MARYLWKPGTVGLAVDAQVAGETLEGIRLANDGVLAPDAIVEASRPKAAPLHACFEWNDAVAAEKYRKEQASYLIRCIAIETPRKTGEEPLQTRAFVSVTTDEDARHYTSTVVAMADPYLRGQVIQNALREVQVWRERYKAYEELAAVFEAVDRVSKRRKAA